MSLFLIYFIFPPSEDPSVERLRPGDITIKHMEIQSVPESMKKSKNCSFRVVIPIISYWTRNQILTRSFETVTLKPWEMVWRLPINWIEIPFLLKSYLHWFSPVDMQCTGKSIVGIRYANFLALRLHWRSGESMHLIKYGEAIDKCGNRARVTSQKLDPQQDSNKQSTCWVVE